MQPSRFTSLLTLIGILVFGIGVQPVLADEGSPFAEETVVTNADTAYDITPFVSEGPNRLGAGEVFQGDNPAQAFDILFSQNGLDVKNQRAQDWQWTLHMLGYGYGDAQTSVGSATAQIERNRIEFHRGDLVEWYINGADGLEQGFTLQNAPAGRQEGVPLVVSMALNSDLMPSLSDDNQTIDFYGDSVLPVLRYTKLIVTDANGTVVPSYFTTDKNTINIVVDDNQAVYPLTIDPTLTNMLTKLAADDGQPNDNFGYVVHTSGGAGNTVAVIGAPGDNTERGAVYTYGLNPPGTAWEQQDKITASDGANGDLFGRSAFVTGGEVTIVGAQQHGGGKGAVYVYERNAVTDTQWVEVGKIAPAGLAAGDEFGSSVSADYGNDTNALIVAIGAPGDSTGKGAAYIYERNPVTPTQFSQTKVLTPGDGVAGDDFGAAVYYSVDLDAVFVGAPLHNGEQGAVYIYQRDEGGPNNWGLVIKLIASDAAPLSRFGTALALSHYGPVSDRDYRLLIGSPRKNSRTGGAYVFTLPFGGSWTEEKIIVASNGQSQDEYGISVSLSGSFAVIGARGNLDDTGKAYYLLRSEGGSNNWGEIAEIFSPEPGEDYTFGHSVASRGSNVIIGAYKDDAPNGNRSGAAYAFRASTKLGLISAVVDVQPDDPATEWNIAIDGHISTDEMVMGDGGIMTQTHTTGTYSVTLTAAGGSTSLDNYSVTYQCIENGVAGAVMSGAEFVIELEKDDFFACTFTLTAPGEIVIAKVTDPADSTDSFSFTSSLATSGSFTLTGGMTETFGSLLPGTYDVTESVPAGWILEELTCDDVDSTTDVPTAKATVRVDAGETVTCTFTNEKLATVAITNVTNPAGSAGYFFTDTIGSGTFGLDDAQTETFTNVPAGQYKVRDLATGEQPLIEITCDDGASTTPSTGDVATGLATINAEAGETVACTFTHAEPLPDTGTIKIIKASDPAGATGFSFTDDIPSSGSFTLDDGDGGKTFLNVPVGTYTVSETAKAGWDLTGLSCDDSDSTADIPTAKATIVLAENETVTCTFTNTEQAPALGSIVIRKVTNPSLGAGFAFTHTIPGSGAFSLDDGGTKTFSDVSAGTYSVTEGAKDGWNLNDIQCDDSDSTKDIASATATIILAAGENVTCTFSNAQPDVTTGSIAIEVKTNPTGGTGFAFTDNVPGSSGSFSLDHGASQQFSDIAAGAYNVTASAKEGWTLNNVLCADSDGGSVGDGATANIDLDAKEAVRCVFEFTENPSTNPAVELTATVGTESDVCATTSTIEVDAGTKVYYCYSVKNTGDVTLTVHSLVDDQLGTILSNVSAMLAPGASVTNIDLSMPATAEISEDTTNKATWKAKESASTPEVGSESSATVTVKPASTDKVFYLPSIYNQ